MPQQNPLKSLQSDRQESFGTLTAHYCFVFNISLEKQYKNFSQILKAVLKRYQIKESYILGPHNRIEIAEFYKEDQIFKFLETSVEKASLLTALARMPIRDFWDYANLLQGPVIFQIIELMHEFSFSTRKAIELSSKYNPEIIKKVTSTHLNQTGKTVHYYDDETEKLLPIKLCNKDFMWIINRIIHSQKTFPLPYRICSFEISDHDKIAEHGAYKYFGHTSDFNKNQHYKKMHEEFYRLFSFQSDKDKSDTMHCIDICDLLEVFMSQVVEEIEEAIS